MAALDTAAALITLAALFSWANHRFIRLPTTIALALSLPAGPERSALITVTYVVVVVSILVQGLTLPPLLRR